MSSPPRSSVSLNARLAAIALLALVACGAALVALSILRRTGEAQRIARAEWSASGAVERLRAGRMRPADRARGVRGGALSAQGFVLEGAPPPPIARRAIAGIALTDEVSTVTSDGDEFVSAAAAVRDEQGRVLWAVASAPRGRQQPLLKLAVLVLALAGVASAAVAMRAAKSVRDGARSLSDGIDRLGADLGAPIETPSVRELASVAERVRLLAAALVRAQAERDSLTRRLAERDRLASLGRVAAGVAHEVRNPLASMKLRVDLARRSEGVTDSLREDLLEVSSEIARLDRLVADLLVLSRTKAPTRANASLGALVRKRAELLQPWADEHNVAIEVEGEASASVDHDAIARAVDNLLRNAVQASPRGRTVLARVRSLDAQGLATITVIDEGAGVPKERERELFEPFFTTRSEGTGLGLALAKATAEAHGGELTYAREQQQRTVFTLSVRRAG
jgi:signal transduction histidine kinase